MCRWFLVLVLDKSECISRGTPLVSCDVCRPICTSTSSFTVNSFTVVNNTKLYSQELDQPTFVNKIVSADDKFMYVEGWDATPVENHLFRVPLTGELKTQLTKLPGWHQTTFHQLRQRQRLLSKQGLQKVPLFQQENFLSSLESNLKHVL